MLVFTIGKGIMVGIDAAVTRDVPEFAVVGGVSDSLLSIGNRSMSC